MGKRHTLPGFGLSLGYTWVYLGLVVLVPMSALVLRTFSGSASAFWASVTDPRVLASYQVSFGLSFLAALVNGVLGLVAAWVLVRYRFPGRRLFDAMVDLPFALPTAVAGIALTAIYSPNEWIGALLAPWGVQVAFTRLGIFLAMVFIGLPFVVRTLQPVIQQLTGELEEAAACLGANRWQTFQRVVFPTLLPALLTGVTLAFGRAIGEYGSVIFIAGNLPFDTEITPLLIVSKLEQHDYAGAAAIGFVLLAASFAILASANALQAWNNKRLGIH